MIMFSKYQNLILWSDLLFSQYYLNNHPVSLFIRKKYVFLSV